VKQVGKPEIQKKMTKNHPEFLDKKVRKKTEKTLW
jgi:hypothetical protein